MVEAYTMLEDAAEFLSVRSVESEVTDRLGYGFSFFAIRDPSTGQGLGLLGGCPLCEVNDVDRSLSLRQQGFDRFMDGNFSEIKVQGDGALFGMDSRNFSSSSCLDIAFDLRGVPQCGRHQEELCIRKPDQGDLPGHATATIAVVVEFIHDHVGCIRVFPLGQSHVGEDFGCAAQDRGIAVQTGISGQHAHVLGPEMVAEFEEFLAHQGFDGSRIEGSPSFAHGFEVETLCDKALPGTGGRAQNDVPACHQFQEGFFLGRIGGQVLFADPGKKSIQNGLALEKRLTREMILQTFPGLSRYFVHSSGRRLWALATQ